MTSFFKIQVYLTNKLGIMNSLFPFSFIQAYFIPNRTRKIYKILTNKTWPQNAKLSDAKFLLNSEKSSMDKPSTISNIFIQKVTQKLKKRN